MVINNCTLEREMGEAREVCQVQTDAGAESSGPRGMETGHGNILQAISIDVVCRVLRVSGVQ